jgi:hypothetical protein
MDFITNYPLALFIFFTLSFSIAMLGTALSSSPIRVSTLCCLVGVIALLSWALLTLDGISAFISPF